jgi:hypothetical protein
MRIHSPQITGSAANTNIVLTTITSSISVLSASFAATASFVQNAQSASFAITASHLLGQSPTSSYALTASFVLDAVSSSFAATASSADNLTVRGTLTAQTINVQTITSSVDYVTGSSINGSLLANTHQFTGSVSVTGSLQVNESNVLLTNQTSSMSVATASYWSGSIINATSASYALTASYASNVPETASYALQANSASFALTASYISGSGGGVGFPFSGSAIITGSLFVSGSTISGSFKGDGSQITGLTAGGKIHTQTSAASTWTVTHNLGVQYPNVTVYDNNNNVIIPQTIVATDANTLTLTFGSAVAGYAVAGIGGIINVQGRTTQQYFTASTTWSFAHNLGDKYVSLQAFDDAFEMMIPTTIRLVDFTSSLLLFDSASSGYAVATIGGDLPAISSSYAGYTLQVASSAPYSASWVAAANVAVTTAQTASYANNFTVGGTLTAQTINVQTITSSIDFVTGSTRNGSLLSNTHEFTGSVLMTGSLTVSGSLQMQHPTSYGLNRLTATGGVITYNGPFTIHTFTSSATFTPSTAGFVEILAVGGGGAGGGIYGGGGGAGGVVHYKSLHLTAGSYTVTIGQGGGTVDGDVAGNDGNPTLFGTQVVAMGGGGGGSQNVNTGRNGASGGGNALTSGTAGHGSTQGNRGGAGLDNGTVASGGGGGGAMSAGGNAGGSVGSPAGQGGIGYFCDISGTSIAYGGGGGGGCALQATIGIGGVGGGGNGAKNADTGVSGTANTGGGGGGAGNSTSPGSGAGGSGVVIVRYLT